MLPTVATAVYRFPACMARSMATMPLDNMTNKALCMTTEEREEAGLIGRMPAKVESMETAIARVGAQFDKCKTMEERRLYMQALRNFSVPLYYEFATENVEKTLPLLYTPGVGDACSQYGSEFGQNSSQGFYLNMSM
ncbi:hypothetical protein KIPB_005084, partial [Kipferlia bialata]|eukprot:g5084.t1